MSRLDEAARRTVRREVGGVPVEVHRTTLPGAVPDVDPETLERVVSCIPPTVERAFDCIEALVSGQEMTENQRAALRGALRKATLLAMDLLVSHISMECRARLKVEALSPDGGRILLDGAFGASGAAGS